MAQLGVAGAGAAVGAIAGSVIPGVGTVLGAQIGWALGGIAGALLFPPKGPVTEGPRLGDLAVQTSGFGVPIPVVAARAKLAGNVIWADTIQERKTTRRQGKGGGGPRTVEYTYSLSWAVGLCEWLIPPANPGVLRIWLNDKLVYDVTGESEVVAIPGLSWRFYGGSETQFPDPLLEAKLGAGNAPAHRGLAYIVFEAVPLTEFGNRMPQATVEFSGEITRSFPQVAAAAPASPIFASDPSVRHYNRALTSNVAVDYARGRIYEGRTRTTGGSGIVADELIRVYDLVTMQALGEYRYDRVLAPIVPLGGSVSVNGHSAAVLHAGADGFLYVAGGTSTHVPIVKIDPDRMAAVDYFGAALDGAVPSLLSSGGGYVTVPIAITSLQCPRLGATPVTYLACVGNYGGAVIVNADTMTYVWGDTGISIAPPAFGGVGAVVNDSSVKLVPGLITPTGTDLWVVRASLSSGPPTVQVSRLRITSGAADLGGGGSMGITRVDYADVDVVASVDASAGAAFLLGALWDETDDTLIITIAGGGPRRSYTRVSTFKWAQGTGPIWALVNHASAAADDARGDAGRLLSGLWGRGGNLVLQPGSGDAIVNAAGATWAQTLAWLDEQQAVVGWSASRTLVKRYLTRAAPVDLTVGDVVAALAERAGMALADIDTAALTDPLRGYVLARPMSARDAMTPLLAYANADAVEQDDVIVFRKRAGSTVAAIPFDDLVRETPDASVIEEQRAQDQDLPRRVTARHFDIERGWEQGAQSWQRPIAPTALVQSRGDATVDLPIPLTADEARSFARRQTVALWRERTRIAFAVGPKYARLVPTDPITVATRDGATLRCRVISATMGGNWITRIEAVTEDAAAYGLTAQADGGAAWQRPEMPLPYYTRLLLPDLALVDDADDIAQAGLREYAFALAYDGTRFRGVQIVRSRDASAWEQLDVVATPSTWGALLAAPAAPRTPWTWDETNSLSVRLSDGDLDSATALEVLNGANRAALVGADGAAEIVQFRTATLEADGSYTLSGLLRGRRGTEDLISTRRAGDAFILLDATRLPFTGELGSQAATRYHRALTVFDSIDTVRTTTIKTTRGRAERPYAPAHLTATRDGSQNITLAAVRRTRIGGEWVDGTGTVPISEASESYEVDIVDGPIIRRTFLALSVPTVAYTAAQQVADFGSIPAAVTARMYQMSGIVGRGIPAEVTSLRDTSLSPAALSFTLQNTTTSFALMPSALQWCDEPFTSDTGQFLLTTEGTIGSFAVASGNGVITHTGGGVKSTQVRTDDDLTLPQAWVEVQVVSRTGTGLTYDNFGVGIIKDGDNFMIAQWDRVAQHLRCQVQFGGTNYFYPNVTGFNPTLPFKMALSVVGRSFAVWTDTGSGWTVQQRGNLSTATGSPDLRTTTLTGWKAGVALATSGDATWNFDNLKAGRFGTVGLRDCAVITEEDGTPVDFSGKVRFTATCPDPSGATYVGVFELNPGTYALSQVGALMLARGSGIYDDLNINIVKTAGGNYKVMGATWGNGFGGDLHIRYVETATNVTGGSHAIGSTVELNLPNVPNPTTTGGCYDPCFVKDGADWLVAYAVVDPTSFAGENFYIAAARTSDFSTFTGIRADTANTINEGPRIVAIDGAYWIVSGGRGEQIIYDAAMNQVGSSITANVPFYNGTDTQPWMTIFPWAGGYVLLTWNNTREGGVLFTWGDLLIYTAPGI